MNRFVAGLSMMLWAAPLLGTEKTAETKSTAAPLPRSESVAFAEQLDRIVQIVADSYVRPVSYSALLSAALNGLYEAARIPIPPALATKVRAVQPVPPELPEAALKRQQRLELIIRIRESLGDLPQLHGSKALEVSLRAMSSLLDPYCQLVALNEEHQAPFDRTRSPFGLDWVAQPGLGALVISKVEPGSPAQKNGLRPGDRITQINGRTAHEAAEAQLLWMPAVGADPQLPTKNVPAEVILTLVRPGSKMTRKVTLHNEEFHSESVFGVIRQRDNSWDFMLDRRHQIALVRIGSFAQGTAEELEQALTELKAKGLQGLVLDLRWCPGGFLKEAVAATRLFLDEVLIAKTKTRSGQEEEYTGKRDVNFLEFPVIVLVNRETMGGAELLAAALQDNQRAMVAGQRTFGKASIQMMQRFGPANLAVKLTTGIFLRPSGKNLHRFSDSKATDDWGVLPDSELEFRVSPELNKQLKEWWLWQTLRPGSSREVLPLDDPVSDPQRQAALRVLVEMVRQVEGKAIRSAMTKAVAAARDP
jgi:carboxyl-terminal processing protease